MASSGVYWDDKLTLIQGIIKDKVVHVQLDIANSSLLVRCIDSSLNVFFEDVRNIKFQSNEIISNIKSKRNYWIKRNLLKPVKGFDYEESDDLFILPEIKKEDNRPSSLNDIKPFKDSVQKNLFS